jgi:hypothetical protein
MFHRIEAKGSASAFHVSFVSERTRVSTMQAIPVSSQNYGRPKNRKEGKDTKEPMMENLLTMSKRKKQKKKQKKTTCK